MMGMARELTKEKLLELYRLLVLAREYELLLSDVSKQGKLPGWIHSALGQEAAGVAAGACLERDDYLVPAHRTRPSQIAKGMDLKLLTAEIYGKVTGLSKGRGGEMHICDPGCRILGSGGIVGQVVPIALGIAYAIKYRGGKEVVLCDFGEGATNTGVFHESMNMAALWRLPLIFFCENNQYAEFTRVDHHISVKDVATRASAYGIPGTIVDGNHVTATYQAVAEAMDRARAGDGPTFIEAVTYRWSGHFEGDPAKYRSPEEVEEWKKRDAIPRFRDELVHKGILNDDLVREIEASVKRQIEEAVRFAEQSPLPTMAQTLTDVYA
jgi:pyruvate dehydrogenase E1 component alpha subunit